MSFSFDWGKSVLCTKVTTSTDAGEMVSTKESEVASQTNAFTLLSVKSSWACFKCQVLENTPCNYEITISESVKTSLSNSAIQPWGV